MVEPMDEREAKLAARAITDVLPHVEAFPANPREYLFLACDRWSVEMFIEALSALAATGRPVPSQMIADMRDWLDRAEPYGYDDPPWPPTSSTD